MTQLTIRETQVLQHLCNGLTGKGIARALGLSVRTVEIHRATAIRKLGARNQTHAAVLFTRRQREVISGEVPLTIQRALCDETEGDGA